MPPEKPAKAAQTGKITHTHRSHATEIRLSDDKQPRATVSSNAEARPEFQGDLSKTNLYTIRSRAGKSRQDASRQRRYPNMI
jgi:hypothetical protein